ncbi:type I-E CRISPR-associated protein Cse1/CasA [Streptomyces regalis]|uniref:type I-E CRISPR-associated protein Cse1/CasA n=1 Tax=Streptomyces regalis TaxID=68262 RepID=UPI0007C6CF07|nr:type I-E CRISPR-associated protein Cse1/CasA [Streptomyces regalis]
MATPSYPIDVRPCIPVRRSDHTEYVGLRTLLADAHRLDDLALPLPPARAALYRILAAICARITGLDDPQTPIQDWLARRRRLLTRTDGFDPEAVHAYFDAHEFDLFHPERPWLQDAALAAQCAKSSGINALVYGRPAGNNLAWFNGSHTDTDPQPLPAREALWNLLAYHYYGPSGRCTARTVGSLTSGQLRAGPLRSTVSFHPRGRTLYETLLLHLTPYRGEGQDREDDACPWEQPHTPHPLRVPPEVTWPGQLLTGRSRHAVLLVADPDAEHVTDAYLTWATQHPGLEATDPYLVYDLDPKAPADRRRSARRADADRALWRELEALVLAGDEHRPGCRPEVFTTLNSLPEDTRAPLRVWVCGFDQDGKVNNRIWYTGLTPPIWPWAQEHDPVKASRIAECRAAAETLAAALHTTADRAWRDTTSLNPGVAPRRGGGSRDASMWARQALASYWPHAEEAFWQLIDDARPAHGVFAAVAITALSEATSAALNHFPKAGPALARALLTLRTAGAPPSDTRQPTGATHSQP